MFSEHRADISFEEGSCDVDSVFATMKGQSRLETGVEVLKFLHRSTICDIVVRKFYAGALMAAVSGLIIEAIVQSVRRILDAIDRSKDLETQLRDLAQQIFLSSAHPLTSHSSMTVEEYFASFTDQNLRWEAIGILLSMAGIALMSTSDSDPDLMRVAPGAQAKDMLRTQVVEASSICVGFCDTAASVSELLGFLQYDDMLLRTQYYGDTSMLANHYTPSRLTINLGYVAWRKLGDLTATIYAAGLHQENTRAQNCPPFLQQWRKMCFAAAFYADKSLSTFVGRPPFINYRYCTISAPLDLSDEDLIAGGERLDQAMSNLDAAGWNPQGSNHRGSMLRLRFLLAVLREQALEIALGRFEDSELLNKYK